MARVRSRAPAGAPGQLAALDREHPGGLRGPRLATRHRSADAPRPAYVATGLGHTAVRWKLSLLVPFPVLEVVASEAQLCKFPTFVLLAL